MSDGRKVGWLGTGRIGSAIGLGRRDDAYVALNAIAARAAGLTP